jgi:hypothetical protein
LGIVNVNVPIRSTIIKIPDGGLNVINPIQPTPESVSQLHSLEETHGPVKNVILTSTAVEHRGSLGPFTQKFPNAKCLYVKGQWTFPLPLGLRETGVVSRDITPLPTSGIIPSTGGLLIKTLGPLKFKSVGTYAEGAVYEGRSKTVVLTDSVASVTEEPPDIIMVDRRPLLYHAR